jgi:hypothetical protein
MSDDDFIEEGRYVDEYGAIRYVWPPIGRFGHLWREFQSHFPDESTWPEIEALLRYWQEEASTLVAYTDEFGEWVDVEPQWDMIERWLNNEQ